MWWVDSNATIINENIQQGRCKNINQGYYKVSYAKADYISNA